MNTKVKIAEFFNKIKGLAQNLSPRLKKMILGGGLAVIIFSVAVAVYLNNKPFETLFSGLNQQEATEIMGKLQEMGIEYKYGNDGAIYVPREVTEQTKAQLVYDGYPQSGFTYDVFKDNISMTTTDFEKNSYKLYELQNRIGATIRLFQGVNDAKVTIAAAEEQKYVLDSNSNQQASATAVVIMNDGGSPTPEQVKGIQRLISKSIPKMEMADVVVLDGNGNDVSTTGDSVTEGANKLKIEFEKHMDDAIRAKILNVLAPIYGADNVRVSVRTTVDVDKKVREIINHQTPQEDAERGIPGTETTGVEIVRDEDAVGGIPGTETNAEVPTYTPMQPDGTEAYFRQDNTVDYLVNQLKEQAQIDAGSVEDITVSVAINSDNISNVSVLDLKVLIGNAAGIAKDDQADKIAVVATPFFEAGTPSITDEAGSRNWIIIGAIATGVLLIILVAVLLLLKGRKKKKKAVVAATTAKQPQVSQEAYLRQLKQKQQEDKENKILNLSNERGLELKNKVRDLAYENPEISAQLIRTWLKGGE